MKSTWRTILLLTTMVALGAPSALLRGASGAADVDNGPIPPVSDPTLARILDQWDRKQQESVTLVASFTERKELKLLAKPVVSHGEFYYSRPNHVRWEYKEPDHKVYVITEDMYTAYFPALKRAEEVPIKKFLGKRMFRFLAVGQRIGDLARYYDFRLAPQSDVKGTHLLLLTPRSKAVAQTYTAQQQPPQFQQPVQISPAQVDQNVSAEESTENADTSEESADNQNQYQTDAQPEAQTDAAQTGQPPQQAPGVKTPEQLLQELRQQQQQIIQQQQVPQPGQVPPDDNK